MTAHELLNFLNEQRKAYEREFPDRRGSAAWPTRRETLYNLNLNREWFPNDRGELSVSFARVLSECRRRGLAEQKGCTPACHARHIILTAQGLTQLMIWKKNGCPNCDDHRDRLGRVVISREKVA